MPNRLTFNNNLMTGGSITLSLELESTGIVESGSVLCSKMNKPVDNPMSHVALW